MSTRVTVHDVAAQAQVEVSEVVNVMLKQPGVDRKVRDRILAAMEELHFPLIPNYTNQNQQTLGIIAPSTTNGEYMGAVLDGITKAARAARIGIRVGVQRANISADLPLFLSDPEIFGILLVSPSDYKETLSLCRHYQLPVATFSYQDDVDLSQVLLLQTNNHQSIVNAVDYLVQFQHHRIGFLTGYLTHNDAQERFEGYQTGLAKHGLPYDESLVYHGNFMRNSGFDGGIALLQQDSPPTALIASSDMMAIGAMEAGRHLGLKAGKDFSVIGFDDVPLASQTSPALTTLAQPYQAMAAAAIDGLQRMATGETLEDYQLRFEANFIIRDTTAAAP